MHQTYVTGFATQQASDKAMTADAQTQTDIEEKANDEKDDENQETENVKTYMLEDGESEEEDSNYVYTACYRRF